MINDYVKRSEALNAVGDIHPLDYNGQGIVKRIKAIPAADVVEVRHASWIVDGYFNEPCVCSNCGEPCKDTVMGKPRWNYCPSCGAKMERWKGGRVND